MKLILFLSMVFSLAISSNYSLAKDRGSVTHILNCEDGTTAYVNKPLYYTNGDTYWYRPGFGNNGHWWVQVYHGTLKTAADFWYLSFYKMINCTENQ